MQFSWSAVIRVEALISFPRNEIRGCITLKSKNLLGLKLVWGTKVSAAELGGMAMGSELRRRATGLLAMAMLKQTVHAVRL